MAMSLLYLWTLWYRVTTHFSFQNSLIFPWFSLIPQNFSLISTAPGSELDSYTRNLDLIPGANTLLVQTLPAFHSVVDIYWEIKALSMLYHSYTGVPCYIVICYNALRERGCVMDPTTFPQNPLLVFRE